MLWKAARPSDQEKFRSCSGIPDAYLGPVEEPTGVGHWSVAIGWDPRERTVLMHDPNGEADLIGGGYVTTAIGSGKAQRYSERNWGRRWMVEGPGSGWWMAFSQP